MRVGTGILAILLAIGWSLAGCGEGSERGEGRTGPRRLLVIGIDSADWNLLEPMIEQGRLPNLAAFRAQSASGRMLTFRPLQKSPVLWASILTGLRPSVHGVGGFVTGEDQQPVRSSAWRAPALWDIAGAGGLSSAVVGMWATYPVREIDGVMVSDYLPYTGHRKKPLKGLIWPDSLAGILEELRVEPEAIGPAELVRFIAPDLLAEAERREPGKLEDLRSIWAADLTYLAVARRLAQAGDFDLFLFYLRGPDMISHKFWIYMEPDKAPTPPAQEEVDWFGQVVPRYYEWVDETLAEVLSWFPPDRQTVIVSDHGFHGPRHLESGWQLGTQEHSPFGIFLVRSPLYEAGTTFDRLDLLDICPTLLALMGLPPSREMPGHILDIDLTEPGQDRMARLEAEAVPSYQPLAPLATAEGEADSLVDDQIRRQLRSLGYIQ